MCFGESPPLVALDRHLVLCEKDADELRVEMIHEFKQ